MIDLVEELVGWLRTRDSLVVLLTKDKDGVPYITPDHLPQEAGYYAKAIVLHEVAGTVEEHLGGTSEQAYLTIQFDCMATKSKTARQIRHQLKTELQAIVRGNVGSVHVRGIVQGGETGAADEPIDGSDTRRYIRTVDYQFAYKAA